MGRGRERDKRGQEETTEMWGIGPYRYFFFPTSSPGEGYGLVVVVPRCLCATGLSLFHTHLIYCSVGVVRQVLSVVKYDNICMIIVVYRPYTLTHIITCQRHDTIAHMQYVTCFRILSRMKCIICMLLRLNILCLICINRQCPQNCIEFDNDASVLLIFYSQYSKSRTISNTRG